MSIFPTHDISLNRYYYSFYSYNPSEDANVIKSFTYDNTQTLVETKDISFNTKSPTEMITFLENSGTNPYAVGKSGADFRSMDLAFGGVYKKGFKETQRQALMTYLNTTYKNIHAREVQEYAVTVSNHKYYLDGNGPAYTVYATSSGIYVFDQSDSTNVTHPLVIGETDGAGTYYSSMFTEGTIGSLNGYTIVDISAGTPDLYYYCSAHSGMGGQIWNFISATTITVKIVGGVYEIDGQSRPNITITPGTRYIFDLADSSNLSKNFMLGLIVDDDSSEIPSAYFQYSSVSQGNSGAYLAVLLEPSYSSTVYYFDRVIDNIGTIPPDWDSGTSYYVPAKMYDSYYLKISEDFNTVQRENELFIRSGNTYTRTYQLPTYYKNPTLSRDGNYMAAYIPHTKKLGIYNISTNTLTDYDYSSMVPDNKNCVTFLDKTGANTLVAYFYSGLIIRNHVLLPAFNTSQTAVSGDLNVIIGRGSNSNDTYNAYLYVFNGTAYTHKGTINIQSLSVGTISGFVLSEDGKTVGISTTNSSVYNFLVYTWDLVTNSFTNTFTYNGIYSNNSARYPVNMSPDGNTIGIKPASNSAHIEVYIYNGSNWIQKGSTIDTGEPYKNGPVIFNDDGNIGMGVDWSLVEYVYE